MPPKIQMTTIAARSWRIPFRVSFLAATLSWLAQAQPADIAKRVAERETAAMEARQQYTYRQTVLIEEMSSKGGGKAGQYSELREVIFSPAGERTERMIGKPVDNLARLKLTDEDFRDVRDVQPFLFTADQLWLYETKPRGEEVADGIDCWLLQVRPRLVGVAQLQVNHARVVVQAGLLRSGLQGLVDRFGRLGEEAVAIECPRQRVVSVNVLPEREIGLRQFERPLGLEVAVRIEQ